MKQKTLLSIIVFVSLVSGALYVLNERWSLKNQVHSTRIAIIMTMNHPALDSARASFSAQIGSYAEIIDYNAHNSQQSANIISRRIAQDSTIDAIFAVGTLAAQSIAKAEKKRPIVVAAISDPAVLGESNINVCGLTDMIDPDFQLDKIKSLLPHLKSLSILYSPAESNSVLAVEKIKEQAQTKNLPIILVGVYEAQHIPSASIKACEQSDAVLIPLDNQLVASMPSVIKATKNSKCIVITSNESPIHQGAHMAFGINYEKSGSDAGIIMKKLLNKSSTAKDIGFINPDNPAIYFNNNINTIEGK